MALNFEPSNIFLIARANAAIFVSTLRSSVPVGYSHRVRKDADEELDFHGEIPLLGEGNWKEEIARYDVRW